MSESTFKAGDVVRLASGGPAMTVEEERGDERLACIWFDGSNKIHGTFDPRVLVKATPSK